MSRKLSCSPQPQLRISLFASAVLLVIAAILGCSRPAFAGDAPGWMHALVSAPLPAHDDKTDAVLLYSETSVSVQSVDKIKRTVREAYKILRPGGREYGTVFVYLNSHRRITGLRGWCIPAQGKDYEVKDKEALEISLPKIEGSELISDVKDRVLRIPAADPGNIVGYEYETEEQPMVLQDFWDFQEEAPVRESHYSLQLPAGWEYKATWLNYPEVKPVQPGNPSAWVVTDVKGVRKEEDMPPMSGVMGQMIISFFPPGGSSANGFSNWQQMGNWYRTLISGRTDPSPDLKQKVVALTSSSKTQLEKMRALAQFVQHDIRYVAIEIGIGGWQPRSAPDIFSHRYGDCKDKATLMGSMLHEVGVDAYYVLINTERGAITPEVPPHARFDHAIIAIKLPEGLNDPSLSATVDDPKLGKILFFDPTSELTPFGRISGYLQANYGLMVTPDGGELVELPKLPSSMNGIRRTAKLNLDANGKLTGRVTEMRVGDRASYQRYTMRTVTNANERIKPIESLLASSLSTFVITKADAVNIEHTDLPFGFEYTFESENYAKNAGDLLLVRPRVIGTQSSPLLETKEPRQFPIEFEGPSRDTDEFEIALPPGYVVDDVPPPVDADFGFASYHSKTESTGGVISYKRSFEIKDLTVPVNKAADLKKFYRIIASDERNTAVLKPAGK
jgi:Domain of Unknown Function with PDB structure (DUF3857)/Transglutaminase-like superfamily